MTSFWQTKFRNSFLSNPYWPWNISNTNNIEQSISFQLHVNVHKCLVPYNSTRITVLLVYLGFHDKIQLTKETWFSQFCRAVTPRSMHLLCFQSLYWIRSLLLWSYLTVSSESLTSWYINNRSQDSNVWMEGCTTYPLCNFIFLMKN